MSSNDVRLPLALQYALKKVGVTEEDIHALVEKLEDIGDDEPVAAGTKKVMLIPTLVDVAPLGEEPRPSRTSVSLPYAGGQSYD